MRRKKEIFVGTLTDLVEYIEQDLNDECGVDSVAFQVLECIEGRVSSALWDLIYNLLLGFSPEMQLEIADDLLDFVCMHKVHTTGCLSVDAVLKSCYMWIAEEQGFSKEEIEKIIV